MLFLTGLKQNAALIIGRSAVITEVPSPHDSQVTAIKHLVTQHQKEWRLACHVHSYFSRSGQDDPSSRWYHESFRSF